MSVEQSKVPTRKLGTVEVGAIGVGCTAMSGWYGESSEEEAIAVFRRAPDLGVTLIDTADMYGPYTSEEVVGRALVGVRDRIVLSTKGGLNFVDRETYQLAPNGTPAYLQSALDASLERLRTDRIDLYYLHRADPNVPIEESIGFLATQVAKGKIRAIGLSEVDVPTLARAHATYPLASVESELSLWTRDPMKEVLPWCIANGVGFVPYAPLGRGFLTGTVKPDAKFGPGDFRASNPRFTKEAMEKNAVYIERVRAIAARHDTTAAQVALAWLLAQAPNVVPIPGMERMRFLEENIGATRLQLSARDLADLDDLPPAVGTRY